LGQNGGMVSAGNRLLLPLTLILAALVGVLLCYRKRIWLGDSRKRKQIEAPITTAANPADSRNEFTLYYACDSLAAFKHDRGIRFLQVASPQGPIDFELSTSRADRWGLPLEGINAEVRGRTESPSAAWQGSVDFLRDLVSVLSLSANAWVGEPRLLSPDNSAAAAAGQSDRPHTRECDEETTVTLFECLGAHPQADQLWDAIHEHRMALGFWSPGQQSLALSHLHKGLMSLAQGFILQSCESLGFTKADLAKTYGVAEADLLPHVLRTELYQDDAVSLRAGELATKRLEGEAVSRIADLSEIEDLHVTTAGYLRRSILRMLALSDASRARLLTFPYDEPSGLGENAPFVAEGEPSTRRLIPIRPDRGYNTL
jgi:hypothetical protein